MPAETEHVKGQDFVEKTKKWLEATLAIQVPYTVYDRTPQTTLELLDGELYRYDLAGYHRNGNVPIYVEAKDYGPSSDINSQYDAFIQRSFSAFLRILNRHGRKIEPPYFIFAASRPFRTSNYHELTTLAYLKSQLSTPNFGLRTVSVTEDDLALFASRIWLIIWSNKQDLMSLEIPPTFVLGLLEKAQWEGR